MLVGGKTGTGDNRHKTYRSNRLVASRPVDRTATFVFFVGDRFYGTVTAHVAGPDAGKFRFTSALATQLLKSLEPQLENLLQSAETAAIARDERDSERDSSRQAAVPQRSVTLAAAEPTPFGIPAASLAEQLTPSARLLRPDQSVFAALPEAGTAHTGAKPQTGRVRNERTTPAAAPDRDEATRPRFMDVAIGRPTRLRGRSEQEVTANLNRLSAAGHLPSQDAHPTGTMRADAYRQQWQDRQRRYWEQRRNGYISREHIDRSNTIRRRWQADRMRRSAFGARGLRP
jgi:hypothetical protein